MLIGLVNGRPRVDLDVTEVPMEDTDGQDDSDDRNGEQKRIHGCTDNKATAWLKIPAWLTIVDLEERTC